jgi:hypothetical protein
VEGSKVRMATYDGTLPPRKAKCSCGGACVCDKPKQPRVWRRFVTRGGELVEIGTVARETR